jgi:lipid A 4'-phosphatase
MRGACMQSPDPRRAIPVLLGAIVVTFGVFAMYPGLDLWVSGLFYRGQDQFVLTDVWLADAMRSVMWTASDVAAGLAVAGLLASVVMQRSILRLPRRVWVFLALLFAMGPGVVVNGLLKRFWGRARPGDVTEFGGVRHFTPPHQWTDQCAANCSFVSGEMAGAVALMVMILVVLWHWRDRLSRTAVRAIMAIAFAFPLLTGAQRIASGRHFLSDVVLSALFILLIATVLSWLLFPRAKSR